MSDISTLPTSVEELTADWLSAAIGSTHHDVEVTAAEKTDVIWGSATKVFMTAEYATTPSAGGPLEKLCVKGGFDPRVREAMQGVNDKSNELEALFFSDLAPRLDVRLPRCWFAAGQEGQGVMVFDDLRAQDALFGDPTKAWSPDRVAAGLENFAELHGRTWGQSFDDVAWLQVGAPTVRQAAHVLFSAEHWDAHFARPEAPQLPESVADRERNLRGYQALWAHDDAASHCLCHGDAHMGNTYMDASGRVLLLDWASSCLAPWSYDIAYFMAGALSVEARRNHERELLAHYLEALANSGGPQLDGEEAWIDYGRHHMHGPRPEDALAVEYRHIGKRTILLEQKNVAGVIVPGAKTCERSRNVDLLRHVRQDLLELRMETGNPPDSALIFPRADSEPWRDHDYRNWRRRHFKPAAKVVGMPNARPYDLRHTYASLRLAEQRLSLREIADQLGNSLATLASTYAHVIADLKGQPPIDPDKLVAKARRRRGVSRGNGRAAS